MTAMNATMDKQAMRRAIQAKWPGGEVRRAESEALCGHILRWAAYRRACVVAGYMPLPREADVMPVMLDALASGKTLLLPRVEDAEVMTLRRVERLDALVPGRWGLLEPPEDAERYPIETVDLLIVPLEGVDPSGVRLGKGGGYYDRLLMGASAVSLGAAMSWQWTERVPAEPWDRPLTAAADAKGISIFSGSQGRKEQTDGTGEKEEKEDQAGRMALSQGHPDGQPLLADGAEVLSVHLRADARLHVPGRDDDVE